MKLSDLPDPNGSDSDWEKYYSGRFQTVLKIFEVFINASILLILTMISVYVGFLLFDRISLYGVN